MRITNTGNVPLTQVRVVGTYDPSLHPKQASRGFDMTALVRGELAWNIDRLEQGETTTRDAEFECLRPAQAAWTRVVVQSAENVQAVQDRRMRIDPAPAAGDTRPDGQRPDERQPRERPQPIVGELKVSIADREDPIQVNRTTTYIVQIENGRNVDDKNVIMTIHVPPGLEFVKLSGPVGARSQSQDGRTVTVTPIKLLRAGEVILTPFYIEMKGVRVGNHLVRVSVDSLQSTQPVVAEEDTTVNQGGLHVLQP
jgi:hypothetical protein